MQARQHQSQSLWLPIKAEHQSIAMFVEFEKSLAMKYFVNRMHRLLGGKGVGKGVGNKGEGVGKGVGKGWVRGGGVGKG